MIVVATTITSTIIMIILIWSLNHSAVVYFIPQNCSKSIILRL